MNVLLLEDDPILANALAVLLDELGLGVIGPFERNLQALKALSDPSICPQVGMLDVHLGAETCDLTARELERRRRPFILMSGASEPSVSVGWATRPRLAKPFGASDVEGALRAALAGASG